MELGYKHVQGGNVPGGHRVLYDGVRKPFITPMKECNSIPLFYGDVVVDIGAYVGTYAIRCARYPVKRVVAYEPTPFTCRVLALTKLPNLDVVNAAVVGDDRKVARLFVSHGIGVTNSVVASYRKAGAIEVPAVRYEEAVREATVVKIDVEGAEYLYDIVQPQLRALIIDFHPLAGVDWASKAEAIVDRIEHAGFRAVVKPDLRGKCGWTRAGSWVREREVFGGYEPMLKGETCCGCGASLKPTGVRSLCQECWREWRNRHRAGYVCAHRS